MKSFTSLIADSDFAEILRESDDRALLYHEFLRMPLPKGFSPREVWEALHYIRATQGISYADLHYYQGIFVRQWYSNTRALIRLLKDIGERTHTCSPLDTAINERSSRRFIVQPLIQETVASIQSDGYHLDYESARAVIIEERPPLNIPEKLACNMHAILYSLEDYDDHELSLELINGMYEDLTAGIDTEALERPEYKGHIWPEWTHPDPESALDVISGIANGSLVDEAEHPIITGLVLACKFWKFTPFPHFNYSLGSVVSRFYLRRKGYPVFCYIPLSSAALAWRNGLVPDDQVRCLYEESGIDFKTDRDWTPYYETVLNLISIELDQLERTILNIKNKDNELIKKVNQNQSINHRQRAILVKALLVPETDFTIASHQSEYKIVYSTARADLHSLVKRGFMNMRQNEREQVFSARYDMKIVIEARF